jgi:hypothetical protein
MNQIDTEVKPAEPTVVAEEANQSANIESLSAKKQIKKLIKQSKLEEAVSQAESFWSEA